MTPLPNDATPFSGAGLFRYSVMLDRTPQVSVVIPAYKAAAYIAETLDSVFAQTFRDFEVIVINDGSPDTVELERVLEPHRERIVYLKQENRGPSAARNAGVRAARADFVAFLDSDDGWQPEFLATQMEFLKQDPLWDMVYCDSVYIGEGTITGKTQMSMSPSKGPATFRALLTEECKAFTSTTVVRRDAVLRAGGFDERFSHCEDYDLWLRVAYQGSRIGYHHRVLGRYRLRSDSLAAVSTKMLASAVTVLGKLEKDLALEPELQAELRRQQARFQSQIDLEEGKSRLFAGDVRQARELLSKAHSEQPTWRLTAVLLALRVAPGLTATALRRLRRGSRPTEKSR